MTSEMGNHGRNTGPEPFFPHRGGKPISLYPVVPLLVIFFHAIGADSPYRTLSYANMALVLYLTYRLWNQDRGVFWPTLRRMACLLSPPIAIVILNFIADPDLSGMKEVRHISSAVFIMLGIGFFIDWKTPHPPPALSHKRLLVLFILAYACTQGFFVLWSGRASGTTPNTHYLAQYCLLLLPAGALLSVQSKSVWTKTWLTLCVITLLLLLLQTHSRPAWLAAIICSLVYAGLTPERRWGILLFLIVVTGILWVSDIGNFAEKSMELAETLHREERVTIWRDTWTMQTWSSPLEWLFGHGLDSFKNDFRSFSEYGHQGVNFNSPHNFVLELVYLSGILGFSVVASVILFLYYSLFRLYRLGRQSETVKLLIITLTGNLLLCSIIVPFYTSYNMLILAIVGGITLSLERSALKK